jgi:NAD(P)H-dependent flavin oxidoreductase YrpB (nitropropane dioxygenase family)
MTTAISRRPARCLANCLTSLTDDVGRETIPDYPIAYDAAEALHAAAKAAGEFGHGAQWAGQRRSARSLARYAQRNWSPASEGRWKRRYLTDSPGDPTSA